MITAEMYPVEVGKVALLKSSHNRLVFVLKEVDYADLTVGKRFMVTYEHEGAFKDELVYESELESPEVRMIEEARFQKFIFDLTAQVNNNAKKGPELVQ